MTETTETSPKSSSGSFAFGGLLLILGVLVLLGVQEIDAIDRGNQDPGPRAMPWALGWILLAGGVHQLGSDWWAIRQARREQPSPSDPDASGEKPAQSLTNVFTTLAAILGYVFLLPVLGFSVLTVVFTAGLISFFGSRWWVGLLSGIFITVTVKVLFAWAFNVPLPNGRLGFPI